jgi:ankyrin repeat protein
MVAIDNDHDEVVRVMLESGANIESTNKFQRTALYRAAANGQLELCRLLLDCGANVNHLDEWKGTPQHHETWWGYLSILKLLVDRGADVSLKNEFSETVSELARSRQYSYVAYCLDSVSRV